MSQPPRHCPARRSAPLAAVVRAVAWLALLLAVPTGCGDPAPPPRLVVRCPETCADAVRRLAAEFSAETGVELEVGTAPSMLLAAELDAPRAADLYVFDDEQFAFRARERRLVREVLHLAVLRPVLAAPAGNPAEISELADLARSDLRVGVPDPERCGLGLHVRTSARYIGAWHAVSEHVDLMAASEPQLADALAANELDVAVLWDATTTRRDDVVRVEELKLEGHARRLTAAVRRDAPHVTDALRFARWMRSSDRGAPVWTEAGFTVIEGGDAFTFAPELDLFVAGRLRPAVEDALADWGRREGATLSIEWGADHEIAPRAKDERPHGLLLFDDRALDYAGEAYRDHEWISSDPLVLVVYGMNPEGVVRLEDLALEHLRVGVLDRESGELGRLAWEALERVGVDAALRGSDRLTTGDDSAALSLAVQRKELDVAVLHGTLAGPPTMRSDVIQLEQPASELHQCFALRDEQEYPELAQRMRDGLRNEVTNEHFFHLGYRWRPRGGAAER